MTGQRCDSEGICHARVERGFVTAKSERGVNCKCAEQG